MIGIPRVVDRGPHGLATSPHHDHAFLVADAAVEAQAEQLVVGGFEADLDHGQLDLEGFGALREREPQGLGERVGQGPSGDVGAGERVTATVCVPDAGHAHALELVVLAHGGERDAVVDLGDLVQRA